MTYDESLQLMAEAVGETLTEKKLRDLAHALAICSYNPGYGCTEECPLFRETQCLGILLLEAVNELIERRGGEALREAER